MLRRKIRLMLNSFVRSRASASQQNKGKRRSILYRYRFLILGAIAFIFFGLIHPQVAFAAPGGKIAVKMFSGLFKGVFGKILLAIVIIVCLPLIPYIIYVYLKESLASRRTFKDLQRLSQVSDKFDWLQVKERVTECFHKVHSAWRKEDMQEAAGWMTNWYWQNQQLAYLDQWEKDGLVNHCRVKSIVNIKPLFLRYRNNGGVFDGSRLVVSITANMEDYLVERNTGNIVQGEKGYNNVEAIWTFIIEDGNWIVANIEESHMALAYAKLANEVPAILQGGGATEMKNNY